MTIDSAEAVVIAADRVLRDTGEDRYKDHVLQITEEEDGWWIRWTPPRPSRGGGPNVFVKSSDGTIATIYYDQ